MNSKTGGKNEYAIGAVAQMTGLTPQVIRAWERRYDAVVANRAPNGRRVYSPRDVEKLTLLKTLTDRGSAIGGIAHLDIETLRARAEEMDRLQHRLPDHDVRVAVLGAFIPALIESARRPGGAFDIVAAGADPARFTADVRGQAPDVLVFETTHLDDSTSERIEALQSSSAAGRVIIAYAYGRRRHERELADRGHHLLRTPVSVDELELAIMAAAGRAHSAIEHGTPTAPARSESPGDGSGAVPPRRITDTQLEKLAAAESAIDCECPRHLVDIIRSLSAFETYSAVCESRDEDDAELHAWLHRTTAAARDTMERTLLRLAEAEDLLA